MSPSIPPRQLSSFLREPLASEVDAVRRRWDPTMADLVAPHVTVCHDLPGDDAWSAVVAAVVAIGPFRLHVGGVETWPEPERGIYLTVDDLDGALAAMREVVGETPPPGIVYRPHITLVHPRTVAGDVVENAWRELEGWTVDRTLEVDGLDVIAFSGSVWRSIQALSL